MGARVRHTHEKQDYNSVRTSAARIRLGRACSCNRRNPLSPDPNRRGFVLRSSPVPTAPRFNSGNGTSQSIPCADRVAGLQDTPCRLRLVCACGMVISSESSMRRPSVDRADRKDTGKTRIQDARLDSDATGLATKPVRSVPNRHNCEIKISGWSSGNLSRTHFSVDPGCLTAPGVCAVSLPHAFPRVKDRERDS